MAPSCGTFSEKAFPQKSAVVVFPRLLFLNPERRQSTISSKKTFLYFDCYQMPNLPVTEWPRSFTFEPEDPATTFAVVSIELMTLDNL